jgi:hypothetical protein
MGMTNPLIPTPLSPPKERRNQEFFFVMLCGARGLGKWRSGKQREKWEFSGNFPLDGFLLFSRLWPFFPINSLSVIAGINCSAM